MWIIIKYYLKILFQSLGDLENVWSFRFRRYKPYLLKYVNGVRKLSWCDYQKALESSDSRQPACLFWGKEWIHSPWRNTERGLVLFCFAGCAAGSRRIRTGNYQCVCIKAGDWSSADVDISQLNWVSPGGRDVRTWDQGLQKRSMTAGTSRGSTRCLCHERGWEEETGACFDPDTQKCVPRTGRLSFLSRMTLITPHLCSLQSTSPATISCRPQDSSEWLSLLSMDKAARKGQATFSKAMVGN